jgi:hypothetical protein
MSFASASAPSTASPIASASERELQGEREPLNGGNSRPVGSLRGLYSSARIGSPWYGSPIFHSARTLSRRAARASISSLMAATFPSSPSGLSRVNAGWTCPTPFSIAPSFNDQPDLEAARASGNVGLAGRAASEVAQPAYVYWTPY